MTTKLVQIPNNSLDRIINNNLDIADKVLIAVSFVFEKGLDLILDKLNSFKHPQNITILTSNYLKSTEPRALKKLLELKSNGAKIYVFDSLKSNQNFHMKSYYFENKKDNFFNCIIGSSNISAAAFQKSYELNVEIKDKNFAEEYKTNILNLLDSPHTLELSEDFIIDYEKVYEENMNFVRKFEEDNFEDISVIPFKEPNLAKIEALKALNNTRNELNQNKGLVVMATGLGKTILAALDVKQFNPKKILFVAHREEILNQSEKAFKQFMPNKKYGFYNSKSKNINNDFIFASIQTIGKNSELTKFKRDNFDYVVIDEFHHVGARSYKKLVEYFKPKFFLGLTATPNRTDNLDILQFCGNNQIYKKDLIDGVNLKLLSNFDYRGIIDKFVDYTRITWRGKKFDETDLDRNLSTSKRANYIFENWSQLKLTRTLGFCASIKHSDYMRDFFLSKGIKAVSIHSKSEIDRSEALKMLTERKIDILFSVDLFNEGLDIPVVDTIMMLRPTESKIIFIQQFGRGLRKAEGKKVVRVIDFIGNHKIFLEKPAALFGFDLNVNSMGKFLQDYKQQKLYLPDDSRVFYDLETIDFFKKYSLKMNKEDFIKYEDGDTGQTPQSQIHKGFNKTDIPKLFKYTGNARRSGHYKMFGHVRPPNVNEQFIFVTLLKSQMEKQHRYQDYFKSNKLFHWQSVKGTKETNKDGQAIINHKKNNSDIHLFVRMGTLSSRKFLYCGKINFLNGEGNGPFDVDFELEVPLPNNIINEFLKLNIESL
jgi:superfamily II DNA or RNA helicase/HKD family nuclease